MGFVRVMVKAGSIGFVEDAVEHVGLFFVAKKAGAQRFTIDARASNRHFLKPPSGPLVTKEGLCQVEFQGSQEDAHRPQKRVSSGAHCWMVARVFCTACCSRIRNWVYKKKRSTEKDLRSIL